MDSVPLGAVKELVAELARRPLAHDVVAACGVRTRAEVAFALSNGFPPESLFVLATVLEDMSGPGMHKAYASGAVMHRAQPFRDTSRQRRSMLGVAPQGVEVTGGRGEFGEPEVRVREPGGERVWRFPETSAEVQFANHFTLGVRVARRRGPPALMAVDTAQSKSGPLQLEGWRRGQGFASAVILTAELGGPFELHRETAPPGVRERWDADPRPLVDFLRAGETDDRARPFYNDYSRQMRDRLGAPGGLFPEGGGGGKAEYDAAVQDLTQIQAYQQWLEETDRRVPQRRRPTLSGVMRRVDRGFGRDLSR